MNKRWLAALFSVFATAAWAGNGSSSKSPLYVQPVDANGNSTGSSSNPQTVKDPNNASYSSASATYATGATVAAGRAVYLNCSASGSVTLSLSGGGSIAYPVAAGATVLPFAVTTVSADTASCTHQNVN